jgi:hypothetical protein
MLVGVLLQTDSTSLTIDCKQLSTDLASATTKD